MPATAATGATTSSPAARRAAPRCAASCWSRRAARGAAFRRRSIATLGADGALCELRAAARRPARCGTRCIVQHARAKGRACGLNGAFLLRGSKKRTTSRRSITRRRAARPARCSRASSADRAHGAFQGRITVRRRRAEDRRASAQPQSAARPRAPRSTPSPSSKSTPTTSNAATAPTVGDLDEAALFYLRARGIPTRRGAAHADRGLRCARRSSASSDAALREHLLRGSSAALARQLED